MDKKILIETEDQRFLRDPSNMALINNDAAAYEQYKARRNEKNKVTMICNEIDSLKQDMGEIKQMLRSLSGVK